MPFDKHKVSPSPKNVLTQKPIWKLHDVVNEQLPGKYP